MATADLSQLDLIGRTDMRQREAAESLAPERRSELGQYFTPSHIAEFIASLIRLPEHGTLRVLDPGAGVGSLTAAVVRRVIDERPDLDVRLMAFEIDESLHDALATTLLDCERAGRVTAQLFGVDFIEWAAGGDLSLPGPQAPPNVDVCDVVVMNPPYRKIGARSPERRATSRIGVEVGNLYAAFLALSASLLPTGGQLVAITPRSFCNGPYFRSFRRYFLREVGLRHLHVFDSRTTVFGADDVIQENVVMAAIRGVAPTEVTVSRSHGHLDDLTTRRVTYEAVVSPEDSERFVRIPATEESALVAERVAKLPAELTDLGLSVSTGRVVDFRARDALRSVSEPGTVPLLYPGHLANGQITWPSDRVKANALVMTAATGAQVLPNETYVLVKRFSAKEERRRVVAAAYEGSLDGDAIAFENHLNVFHSRQRGLPTSVARGLALFLNTTVVDQFVRLFSGHSQINATDLRQLRYPSLSQLAVLGDAAPRGQTLDQGEIDALAGAHVAVLAR